MMRDALPPSLVFDLFMADHCQHIRRAEREGARRATVPRTPGRLKWLAALARAALHLAPARRSAQTAGERVDGAPA